MSAAETAFDVAIVGGGPAGSTLAAILRRRSALRVVVIEKDVFPREHIGESFAHRAIPILAQSGALEKVLASDCWIKKFGGYYAWDMQAPNAALFETQNYERDGVLRWAIHVNRPEFDTILLRHAESTGACVIEGVRVTAAHEHGNCWNLELDDGTRIRATYVVDASGRTTSVITGEPKEFLSSYKNVALWTHVIGGRPAQSLPGNWNIFREHDLSAIGSFAFEDGWFWYIPVPRTVKGERVRTHSLGMVTAPQVLKRAQTDYRDPSVFMRAAMQVPLLSELLTEARPTDTRLKTATNYSMISRSFCSLDQRWILIGDAACFVDPLFSSGVAFAVNHAATAALLLSAALGDDLRKNQVRELWRDYDYNWHRTARGFGMLIEQWYHAIARRNPSSVYWNELSSDSAFEVRDVTLGALVDTDVSPDLVQVLTRGTNLVEDLEPQGPLAQLLRLGTPKPAAGRGVQLDPEVVLEPSLSLGLDRLRAPPAGAMLDPGRYWADPVRNMDAVPALFESPVECHKARFRGRTDGPEVPVYDHDGVELVGRLRETPASLEDIAAKLQPAQSALMRRLLDAGMIVME